MALFGRQPVFGLKAFNLPEEIVDNLETEDELMEVLGQVVETETTEEEEEAVDNNVVMIEVPDNFEMQDLTNIPIIVGEIPEVVPVNGNDALIEDINNSSMEGCISCSNLYLRLTTDDICVNCQGPYHKKCLQQSLQNL